MNHPNRDRAREALHDESASACPNGNWIAERDADRLEAIATRLVCFMSELEPAFDQLDLARDTIVWTGPNGLRRHRAPWAKSDLCVRLAEVFDGVLSPAAMSLLTATVEFEAAR